MPANIFIHNVVVRVVSFYFVNRASSDFSLIISIEFVMFMHRKFIYAEIVNIKNWLLNIDLTIKIMLFKCIMVADFIHIIYSNN